MPWLVSYRFQATFLTDRGISVNNANIAMDVIDEAPADFVLNARRKVLALRDATYSPAAGVQRADNVLFVYSAIELSRDQAEDLRGVL